MQLAEIPGSQSIVLKNYGVGKLPDSLKEREGLELAICNSWNLLVTCYDKLYTRQVLEVHWRLLWR
jgi:hypothetical protein